MSLRPGQPGRGDAAARSRGQAHSHHASFTAWEGGGEYNVARGLRRCFGLRTAIVTALADNPVGRLVEDLMLQGGVDLSYLRWVPTTASGARLRNGLNFTERGFGPRGAVGCSDRGHTAVSQLTARRRRLGAAVRRATKARAGCTPAACSARCRDGTPAVARAAMEQARRHGTLVSYDLNYRDSLWRSIGGKEQAREVNRALVPFVDVLFGNEEDFSAALGFELPESTSTSARCRRRSFRRMIARVVDAFPNIKTVATTLRTAHSATVNGWGAICYHEGKFYEVAAARRRDLRSRRRRRFVRLGLHLRLAGRQGSAVGARVRRRARRAGDVHARRHDDGDVGRGPARDEGLGSEDREMSDRRSRDLPARSKRSASCPVVRLPTAELAMRAVEAVLAGGISIFEVTMTVPDAVGVIRAGRALRDRALVGAGTVLSADEARPASTPARRSSSAPGFDLPTIAAARARDMPVMPGALTPTEVITAWKAGADMVKIFPCSAVGGAKYLRALQGPLPQVKLLPPAA